MTNKTNFQIYVFWLFLLTICIPAANGQQSKVQKIALVVGNRLYDHKSLTNLHFAENDADEVAKELKKQGFTVNKLPSPTKAEVTTALDNFTRFAAEKIKEDDIVVIFFSGHGVQREVPSPDNATSFIEEPFLCVRDSNAKNPSTMLSLNRVLADLRENSKSNHNFLIVDACRNTHQKSIATIDGGLVRNLHAKISILFSTTSGNFSYESNKVKLGVFTHVFLEGLRGGARSKKGDITWVRLSDYVINEVNQQVTELTGIEGAIQQPNLVRNIQSAAILATTKIAAPPVDPPKDALSKYLTSKRVANLLKPFCSLGYLDAASHPGLGHEIELLHPAPMSLKRLVLNKCLEPDADSLNQLVAVANNNNDRPSWPIQADGWRNAGKNFLDINQKKVNKYIEAQRILRDHNSELIEMKMLRSGNEPIEDPKPELTQQELEDYLNEDRVVKLLAPFCTPGTTVAYGGKSNLLEPAPMSLKRLQRFSCLQPTPSQLRELIAIANGHNDRPGWTATGHNWRSGDGIFEDYRGKKVNPCVEAQRIPATSRRRLGQARKTVAVILSKIFMENIFLLEYRKVKYWSRQKRLVVNG